MVLDYYKLAEQPFGVTPDPRFLYLSKTHREAMASTMYALQADRGFSALIAPPGMGKTTILFDFLEKLRGHSTIVFLFQAQSSHLSLLRNILADLGIDDDGTDGVRMQYKLNECVVKERAMGRKMIVVLDEAQNLDNEVLESVRMLSNFETSREKLMHLILAGQPALAEKLASPRLAQFRQRISILARLHPLNADDTRSYIHHRLRVAGSDLKSPVFSDEALAMIARYSGGIPRNINNLCFNAMAIGCADRKQTIEEATIHEVVNDLNLEIFFPKPLDEQLPKAEADLKVQTSNGGATRLRAWATRCGLVTAVALLALLTFVKTRSDARSVTPVSAPEQVDRPTQLDQGSASTQSNLRSTWSKGERVTSSGPGTEFIVVKAGQTLCEISTELFGKCEEATLAQFRQLNPSITNPDHIEIGQTIRLPGAMERHPSHGAENPRPVATAEMEKQ
jgi:general secretion pathway protein A